MAPSAWCRPCASVASASTGAWSGEPSSERVLGDTIKVGPPRLLQRPAHGARRAGPYRLPAAGGEPGAHPGAGTGRADQPRMGSGQRALPADELPGLEPQRGHRRPERHPRGTEGALQPALLARCRPWRASRPRSRRSCSATRCATRSSGMSPASRSIRRPGTLSQAVGEAVESISGIRPKLTTGGGTSDGRFIAPLGAQVVELGVINAVHPQGERVRARRRHRQPAPHVRQRTAEPAARLRLA